MYRTILVPLDGSQFAEHALPVALALARRSGARLHLVSVSTPLTAAYLEGIYLGSDDLDAEVNTRYRAYLDGMAVRLREYINVPITDEVRHGEVAPALCQLASGGEYDLVVMATHGRGPLGRFWLGSVADEVIRHVTLPVLLVRPEDGEARLDEEPDLSRVVVPLDGTPLAEQILEPAIVLALGMPGAEIDLVRVIGPVMPDVVPVDFFEPSSEIERIQKEINALQEAVRHEAETYLAGVARRLEERGLRVRTHVVLEEKPAEAILHEATAEHAGLIALETHGRGGLSRLFRGSVADKVVRGAHVPVLVHRPVNV